MPNVTTLQKPSAPASAPRLPAWLEKVCEAHDGVPWQVPVNLPTLADLRSAIAACESLINDRVSPAHAKQCLAKMLVAIEPNTKLSADEMRLRAMVWLEANGDLSDGLWSDATTETIRTCKWAPKPAEFRAFVEPRVVAARAMLWKLHEMVRAHSRPAAPPYEAEPLEWRLRATIWRGWRAKVERPTSFTAMLWGWAIRDEKRLARIENREPAPWATA